jgi:hypothetical protein
MAVAEFLEVPERDAPAQFLMDWLELACLINIPSSITFAELINALDLDTDRDPSDPAEVDEFREQRFADVERELRARTHALNGAYPFILSADSLKLLLVDTLDAAHHSYIFSLILSHAVGSELVPKRYAPSEDELRIARELFQICSTVAAAGHTGGPSFSIGWPRTGADSFHAKLKYCWEHFRDGGVVEQPSPSTPLQLKDDGLDVLSFWLERDGGPSQGYLVGQVASGNNWKDKSAKPVVEILEKEWLSPPPAAEARPVTFIPFYIPESETRRTSIRHGYVMGRLRLARSVRIAIGLGGQGLKPIERIDEMPSIANWLAQRTATMRSIT